MKMYDCDVCLSAGSVNQWGFCEICGEDFEDAGSRVWRDDVQVSVSMSPGSIDGALTKIGQDAA